MRRIRLHSYVPDALIPAYAVVTGRRQCCGAYVLTRHFDECPKTLRRRGRMRTTAVPAARPSRPGESLQTSVIGWSPGSATPIPARGASVRPPGPRAGG